MNRVSSAVEYRAGLRTELAQLESIVRPEDLTLIELNAALDVYRPAAQRVKSTPPGRIAAR